MKTFKKAPIALAVTALMAAPAAFAQEFTADSSIDSEFNNKIEVDLSHKANTYNGVLTGLIVFDNPAHYSGAIVDSKQFTDGNGVNNQHSENNARVGSGAGSGATGNVGINVAAGDNNAQANDAALAASDAADVFGQAEAYAAQHAAGNTTINAGSPNDARLGSGSLRNASGNIGVNVAAGTSNVQQNSLAAAANENSGHAQATTGGVQQTFGNSTSNVPHTREVQYVAAVDASISIDASNLTMDQSGDVYLDTWEGRTHPGGSNTGHVDVDSQAQGAQDLNNDGGAFVFKATDDSILSGTITGELPSSRTLYTFHSNDATLGSDALQGVSGNVGVNIAAGTNNLQRNSLSIASSMGGGNGGGSETR
jgi:hypothetical protein